MSWNRYAIIRDKTSEMWYSIDVRLYIEKGLRVLWTI